ncbi:MFS general substrate transporter [Mycena indigotica]|uniref:MFS general substrate transporter n=1 Tax=Mycena indigotica TaxID=2126181 RepID=A0A8H6SHA7_9AGAR|nr:MFS general substrate transporter [Mycena indigotica]KAF7299451.1 MFS general substrate transporter [Mycena indigotica]
MHLEGKNEDASPVDATSTRKAWLTLAGAFLLQFVAVGPIMSFGVFQDFYSTDFLESHSASDISWIGGVQLFLYLGCGALGGKMYDSGFRRLTFVCGSLVHVVSFFMLSLAKRDRYYQVMLSQGIGIGLGAALVYVPTFTVVVPHFKAHRALVMGILSTSTPLATIVFTILFNEMIFHGPGFAWAVRTGAFLCSAGFVLGQLMISFVVPQSTDLTSQKPEDSTLSHSLRASSYLLTLLAGFSAQLGTLFPTFYLQTFAQAHGFSKALVLYIPVIMNAATIFGRIIPNLAADKWGPVEVYIPCLAANGVVAFGMLGAQNTAGLVCFAIFFGFFFGSSISLYFPVVAALVPKEGQMGRMLGYALLPVGVSSLVGPPIAGKIIGPSTSMHWWKGIIFSAANHAARQLHDSSRRTYGSQAQIQVIAVVVLGNRSFFPILISTSMRVGRICPRRVFSANWPGVASKIALCG